MDANDSAAATGHEQIQSQLEQLCQQFKEAIGDELISVVLYGEAVRDQQVAHADINLLIVLRQVTLDLLDQLAIPLQVSSRQVRLSTMVLSRENLLRSTDVFPIKFLDMQHHHRLLCGEDVLADLKISRDHLRLRCEQELKNLMIRLRQLYLRRHAYGEQIEQTLTRVIESFMLALGTLVELKQSVAAPRGEAMLDAATELGLDMEPVRTILGLRDGNVQADSASLKQLYASFMQVVQRAAELADSL